MSRIAGVDRKLEISYTNVINTKTTMTINKNSEWGKAEAARQEEGEQYVAQADRQERNDVAEKRLKITQLQNRWGNDVENNPQLTQLFDRMVSMDMALRDITQGSSRTFALGSDALKYLSGVEITFFNRGENGFQYELKDIGTTPRTPEQQSELSVLEVMCEDIADYHRFDWDF
jgi:hypothetical protein